jgi:hypothetical protein
MLKTFELAVTDLIHQSPGHIVSDMGGEKVMMSIEQGNYYNLGEIGGIIWDRIENPITLNDLINRLTSEYDIEKEECEKQVVTFLATLKKENLIQISSSES